MKHELNAFSFWRRIVLFSGLLIIGFGGFYLLNIPAKTQGVENRVEQNLVNGRLAFSRRDAGPSGFPGGYIVTSNPDGSERTTLTPGTFQPSMPAWSPDGTRIAFNSGPGASDIHVMNASGGGATNLTNTAASETNASWSVTGTIAYERASQIWVMNADGSGQAQFSGITQPSPTGPAWSPDGLKLAFSSGGEIWVINANGTNELRLTTTASTDTDPAWSPDGLKIVFTKGGSVAVMNADGSNEMSLSQGGAPAWSPDGTKIAFRGASGIWTMDANGSNQVRVVTDLISFPLCCDWIFENPAWQPFVQPPNTYSISGQVTYDNSPVSGVTVNLSGTSKAAVLTDAVGNYQFSGLTAGGNYTVSPSFVRYYFTPPNRSFNNLSSNQSGNFEVLGVCRSGNCVKNGKIAFERGGDIFTMNNNGTNQVNITPDAADDIEPNWSPDGSKIAYATNLDGNNEIYRMNENGSSPIRLTNNAAADISPYHSPDGASIIFISGRDGNSEIYKMDVNGSNQVRLTNTPTVFESGPAFSPDGQKIIFVTTEFQTPMKLWSMNADGSNRQQFPDSGSLGNFYNRPSYSPDGTKILFRYGADVTLQSTWTMNANGTNRVQFPAGNSATYSPDGRKVAHVCCSFDFTSQIHTVNINGSSDQTLTPSTSGNHFPHWQPLPAPRPAQFDFDGDGRSDISVFRPSNRTWYLLRTSAGYLDLQWANPGDLLAPADYDGDLKTDVAVWRPSDGNFYVVNSFDNTIRIENFGLSGDIPTGGDWDGDNKADVAVFREGGQHQGFHYRASMGNPNGNVSSIPWGMPGDKPVAGDYDGDGRTDAAVFRPSTATWYVRPSSNGGLVAVNFGLASDKLVPADYDGDGKTDIAVFRGTVGTWYYLRSSDGAFAYQQFGSNGDIPVVADYDGDGRANFAVWRPSTGFWYTSLDPGINYGAVLWGQSGDVPIPSAYVR